MVSLLWLDMFDLLGGYGTLESGYRTYEMELTDNDQRLLPRAHSTPYMPSTPTH
jgi:hypothetical protein